MKRWLCVLSVICLLQTANGFAWNAVGHRLVAQIAANHLTPHAKRTFNFYNHALDKEYEPMTLVNAAVWLDNIQYHRDVTWYSGFHYVNLYFSDDGSALPTAQKVNAVWAVEQSKHILQSTRTTDFDKGFGLRVLLHVVGDLHQPLHAATRISARFPQGDRGGNLVKLGNNDVARNLHSYWDKGAGILVSEQPYRHTQLAKLAADIDAQGECDLSAMDINPSHWADESNQIAINYAYKIKEGDIPDKKYQDGAQKISEQRIALAGCRLAALLNQIDEHITHGWSKKSSKRRHK